MNRSPKPIAVRKKAAAAIATFALVIAALVNAAQPQTARADDNGNPPTPTPTVVCLGGGNPDHGLCP